MEFRSVVFGRASVILPHRKRETCAPDRDRWDLRRMAGTASAEGDAAIRLFRVAQAGCTKERDAGRIVRYGFVRKADGQLGFLVGWRGSWFIASRLVGSRFVDVRGEALNVWNRWDS